MTYPIDFYVLGELRKEAYEAGYKAALQDMARFPSVSTAATMPNGMASIKPKKTVRTEVSRQSVDLSMASAIQPESLTDIILPEIKRHPEGLSPLEIKHLVRSGKSQFARHPKLGKRVDTAIGRMKKADLIVKRPNGKLYPAMEGGLQN